MKDLARKIHRQVRNHFIWTADKKTFGELEHWRSFADEIERGEVFMGDCDDFCLACAELLIRQEADPAKVRIALCKVETGGGHLVCIADGWALDNRERSIISWDLLPYTWIKYMRMDNPGKWKTMK